jgi:uncharacterized protein YcnI
MTVEKARHRRVTVAVAGALIASGLTAADAGAHAVVSPPVAEKGVLQQFALSVPTEKEKATTTKIELDLPSGFNIDSYEPAPGWKRQVTAKGSGEDATVQKVVWTGGKVPTEEDAVFRFNASASSAKNYTFHVQQSYSDGSVVDWSGPESSDTPAPTVDAVASLGGGSGSSNTLAVIALIAGGLALILSIVGLAGGRRSLT